MTMVPDTEIVKRETNMSTLSHMIFQHFHCETQPRYLVSYATLGCQIQFQNGSGG